ncbi:MAG: DUF559 domain-containing protein [Chloroflexota bacterium]|nr:DUF559 domain-containing protein [Chloroflexota bacterium]
MESDDGKRGTAVKRERVGRGIAPGGVANARALRQRMTPAEEVLWRALRGRRFAAYKFRRPHPVGPFVLDFCCPAARLVVEVDGAVHDRQAEQDDFRTGMLEANDYRILRFWNEDVLGDVDEVLNGILVAILDTDVRQQRH